MGLSVVLLTYLEIGPQSPLRVTLREFKASANIASVGYDKEKKILEVEFHNGGIYQYFDVPEKVYLELINAPSHAAYFMHEVKEKFNYLKIM